MSEKYFNALVELINGCDYKLLLKELHKIHFYPKVSMDKNRIYEVVHEMRPQFHNPPKTEWVSIFEIFVLLALKYEEFSERPGVPDRTATWFWCFMVNCGLNSFDDLYFTNNKEEVLNHVLKWASDFNNRNYGRDGRGSPFPLKNPPKDMRKIELFYQLSWYFNENN